MTKNTSGTIKKDNKQYHIAIGIIFLLISFGAFYLHSEDLRFQTVFIEFYYIPVIIAAIAFGWKWGIFYGLASAMVTFVVFYAIPSNGPPLTQPISLTYLFRMMMFVFIGGTAGYVSHREKIREMGYQKLTKTIELLRVSNISKDKQNWLDQILDAAEAILKPKAVESISIMLLDETEQFLRIVAARGLDPEIIKTTYQPVSKGIGGFVVQSGKPLLLQDFGKYSDFIEKTESEYGITSSICVPLVSNHKTFGVMNASTHSRRFQFDDSDLAPFVILGHAVSLTIENADLHKGLKSAYLQTIHSLARTINMKDKYTFDHSEKIAEIAIHLAEHFNFSEKEKEDLYAAALLHDIGKIGVRDSILFKAGRLTDEEYEEIKKHSSIGLKILEPLENMRGVGKLILHHQERYDGSGYPAGLKGEDIPLGSRILSVVDAWHAMTSDRIYRKALSRNDAILELIENRGKQFDPKIVDAFMDILKLNKTMFQMVN